jgi:hypothetical protein
MNKKHLILGLAMAGLFNAVQAERIDGIEYGEPDNQLLKRIDSARGQVDWKDPAQDLEALGKFGDGTFWVSDKSVRRNWQGQVILKIFKTYDKPKFFRPTNDPFKRQKRTAYTATESIVALDCAKKVYSVKAESLYASDLSLVDSDPYPDEFVAFKPNTPMAHLQQKYCL